MAIKRPAKVTTGASKPLPRTWISLDMETTGFDRVNDRIIEIGAVRFTEGEPVAMFNCLVSPEREISPEVEAMTGHTNADLQKGLDEWVAIELLYNFIEHGIVGTDESFPTIVGHNVLFDYEFYIHAVGRNWHMIVPENISCAVSYDNRHDLIDTLTIGRDRYPYPHKLPDMCRKLGVEQTNWHSAYFDALACGELLLKLHAEKSVADYINVIGWKRQYGEPAWYPDWVTLKPQGNKIVNEAGAR